jgi:hypothetical protein
MSPHPENNDDVEPSNPDNQTHDGKSKRHVSLRGRWKRTATVNKMIAIATIIGATSTLAYAIFAAMQWNEIRKGSADTHELAVQAKNQAAASKTAADAATSAAKAATSAASTAKKQLEMSERPWLAAKIEISGQLRFDSGGGILPLNIFVTNIGHSPAQYTGPRAKLVVGWDIPTTNQMRAICDSLQTAGSKEATRILFPSDVPTKSREIAFVPTKEIKQGLKSPIIPGKIGLSMVTCIEYISTFSAIRHHSEQLYAVSFVDPQSHMANGGFDPKGEYPTIVLFLQPRNVVD